MQIVNVSRGGTLIQDINSQVPGAIKHEQGPPRDRPSHHIRLQENTRLSSIAGVVDGLVNSFHHQAIESIGAHLVATAWSRDGVVEALEDPRPDQFIVAVQWHPEIGWQNDLFSQRLFRTFVNEANHARETDLASVPA
jgi:putative glutamine amidotransferase